jgi:hypothetical protein
VVVEVLVTILLEIVITEVGPDRDHEIVSFTGVVVVVVV